MVFSAELLAEPVVFGFESWVVCCADGGIGGAVGGDAGCCLCWGEGSGWCGGCGRFALVVGGVVLDVVVVNWALKSFLDGLEICWNKGASFVALPGRSLKSSDFLIHDYTPSGIQMCEQVADMILFGLKSTNELLILSPA